MLDPGCMHERCIPCIMHLFVFLQYFSLYTGYIAYVMLMSFLKISDDSPNHSFQLDSVIPIKFRFHRMQRHHRDDEVGKIQNGWRD